MPRGRWKSYWLLESFFLFIQTQELSYFEADGDPRTSHTCTTPLYLDLEVLYVWSRSTRSLNALDRAVTRVQSRCNVRLSPCVKRAGRSPENSQRSSVKLLLLSLPVRRSPVFPCWYCGYAQIHVALISLPRRPSLRLSPPPPPPPPPPASSTHVSPLTDIKLSISSRWEHVWLG